MAADTTFAALDGAVVDGEGIFSLTTVEPVHEFAVQMKSLEGGVAVYRDDVLVSAATEGVLSAPTPEPTIQFTSGSWKISKWQYTYSSVDSDASQYVYLLTDVGGTDHSSLGIKYDWSSKQWLDFGSNVPAATSFPQSGTVITTNEFTFTDPYHNGKVMFTHRVSHFLAVVGSGTSPAVSEFRAWYGATRAIVGAHDAREILDWVTVHPTTHTGEGTLFDGLLDLHPTSPLRFETAATDKVLLYAQIPKNVIPTSGAVWSEELVSASLYLADDLPSVPSYLSTNSPTVFKFYIEEPADHSSAIAIKTFQVLGANFTTVFETGVNKCTQTELEGLSRGYYFAAWGSGYSCCYGCLGETDAFKTKGTLVFTITTDATPTAFEVTTLVNQYPGWKITDDDGVVLLVSKNEASKTTFKHMISMWTTKLLDGTLYEGH
jgi:hypothetical protein